MSSRKTKDPRLVASSLIQDVLDQSFFVNELLNDSLSAFDFPKRRFITELVYGTVRHLSHLDYWILKVFKKPLKRMDKELLALIRVSLYQILFMSNREAATIVFEAAELAKRCGNEKTAGFVNFILREILRTNPTRENMEADFGEKRDEFLQTYYSVPQWLFDRIKTQAETVGQDIEDYLKIVNKPLGITLRIEGNGEARQKLIEKLVEKGATATPAALSRYGIYTNKAVNFSMLKGFDNIFIQDESSQLSVLEMDIKPGDKILDMCAAPGGKTLFASYLTGVDGFVTAVDVNGNRLNLLADVIIQHGKKNIEMKLHDATKDNPDWHNKYDKVLLDAPCSALGTIRRHPEIKWIKNNDDPVKMAAVSGKILERAGKYLKKDGILVFSVCTFTKEETLEQIKAFSAHHPEFSVEKSYFTVTGPDDNRDIFFICRMRKIK